MSDFFNDVYEVVKLIPKGRVTSYGAIGVYLGAKRSARMVGFALNSLNHNAEGQVPAHRVVNRLGQLSGAPAFSNPSMAERLMAEGIVVEDGQIVDFAKYFWNPMDELSL